MSGQDVGGLTPIAQRTAQEVTADARPVVRTPAATPEMTAPAPESKPTPTKPVPKPVEKSPARKPSTGKQVQVGPARTDTPNAAPVPFGGLASSAAGGLGGFIPPLVMGSVYGHLGSYAAGLLALAVVAVIVLLLSAASRRPRATAVTG